MDSPTSTPLRTRDAVAAEVRAEMGRRRISAVELAANAGIGIDTLRGRLNGSTAFTLDELDRVSASFGLTPAVLLERSAA